MTDSTRPLPTITIDSEPYWASTREHAMRIQRCDGCGLWRFYPTPVCPACANPEASWERVVGTGHVYSFTEVHKPAAPAFAAEQPVVLLLVTLAEGPTMMGNLIGPRDDLHIGMEVTLDYTDLTDTITLPGFRAAV